VDPLIISGRCVTAVTLSGKPRTPILLRLQSILIMVGAHFHVAARTVSRNQAMRNLASMPLTIIGIASIVAGILTVSLISGLIVLGLMLIVLEYLIADGK